MLDPQENLVFAIMGNDIEAVKKHLAICAEADKQAGNYKNVYKGFIEACRIGYLPIVKIFIDNGYMNTDILKKINLDEAVVYELQIFRDSFKRVIFAACSSGNLEVVKLFCENEKREGSIFVEKKSEVFGKNLRGIILQGNTKIVEFILENFIDKDIANGIKMHIDKLCDDISSKEENIKQNYTDIIIALLRAGQKYFSQERAELNINKMSPWNPSYVEMIIRSAALTIWETPAFVIMDASVRNKCEDFGKMVITKMLLKKNTNGKYTNFWRSKEAETTYLRLLPEIQHKIKQKFVELELDSLTSPNPAPGK